MKPNIGKEAFLELWNDYGVPQVAASVLVMYNKIQPCLEFTSM